MPVEQFSDAELERLRYVELAKLDHPPRQPDPANRIIRLWAGPNRMRGHRKYREKPHVLPPRMSEGAWDNAVRAMEEHPPTEP